MLSIRIRKFTVGLIKSLTRQNSVYTQGQSDPDKKGIREYFYYIDHQGQLFLDDVKIKNFTSCFKEQKFLQFFYKNLRPNSTNRYTTLMPFISLCGRERNFIHCNDVPFVFTELDQTNDLLYLNNVKTLSCKFQPDLIYVSDYGRFYYPFIDDLSKLPTSIGLIKSSISIELLKSIQNKSDTEIQFTYKSQTHLLNCDEERNKKMNSLLQQYSSYKYSENDA